MTEQDKNSIEEFIRSQHKDDKNNENKKFIIEGYDFRIKMDLEGYIRSVIAMLETLNILEPEGPTEIDFDKLD